MADPQAAVKTQLANIEKRAGKSRAELRAGEVRDYFKRELATNADEVDGDVIAWVRQAFEGAG